MHFNWKSGHVLNRIISIDLRSKNILHKCISTNQMEKIIVKNHFKCQTFEVYIKIQKHLYAWSFGKSAIWSISQLKSKANCETRMKWGFFQFFEFIRKKLNFQWIINDFNIVCATFNILIWGKIMYPSKNWETKLQKNIFSTIHIGQKCNYSYMVKIFAIYFVI